MRMSTLIHTHIFSINTTPSPGLSKNYIFAHSHIHTHTHAHTHAHTYTHTRTLTHTHIHTHTHTHTHTQTHTHTHTHTHAHTRHLYTSHTPDEKRGGNLGDRHITKKKYPIIFIDLLNLIIV